MPGSQASGQFTAYDGDDPRTLGDNRSVTSSCSKAVRYVSRDEIKAMSPSRRDGIDSATENDLRRSFCRFLRELGIKLRMPSVAIATSTVFCHRFYLHQSHHKNDRFTIATACMFLAGKVEEHRRPLEDVVALAYCLRNRNNPVAAQEMRDKDLCEKQKELVLVAEQIVLVTLDFNLQVWHPYSFITAAPYHKTTPETLWRVAFIMVNDSLFTTLCLQFEPQHIAASAVFLAAKLLKYKIPHRGWWKEFNVTLRQLEAISIQILELYEERLPPSVVQSSSSSSSIDEKLRGGLDAVTGTPDPSRGRDTSTYQWDDASATFKGSLNYKLSKDGHSIPRHLEGRPSASTLVLMKSGTKDSIKSVPKSSQPKPFDSEVMAKRRKLDEGGLPPGPANSQFPVRHKIGGVSQKEK